MGDLGKLVKCGSSGGGLCNYTRIRLRTEENVANNTGWYMEEDDYTVNERKGSYKANTDETAGSGSHRTGLKVNNFTHEISFTFAESITSGFLQLMHQVQLQPDEYIAEFMQCGLDVQKITCFPDGGMTIKTYEGVTTTSMDEIYMQVNGAENEVEIEWTIGNEPIIMSIGFGAELPSNVKNVTATITAGVSGSDISVAIDEVVDVDNLIVADSTPWIINVYNLDDYSFYGSLLTTADPLSPVTFTDVPAGKYQVSVSYLYFIDSSGQKLYHPIFNKELEVL